MSRGQLAVSSLVLAVVMSASPAAGSDVVTSDPRLATALARLDVRDLDGHRWTIEDLKGRVALLSFWTTSCAPCLAELPHLRELHAAYPEDFLVLGINMDVGSRHQFVGWLQRHRIPWPQVHDGRGRNGDAAVLFRVWAVPFSVLLDRDGRPVAVNVRGKDMAAAVAGLVERSRPAQGPPVPGQTRR
jgi:thiol-disulfide isomerase/thioredoxin